mmetsp:Transcript_31582/g.44834  ORF Transcript_31582/g.44834 Transcript_31582/m.44834 type:complete len:153 (+) Transcript_31582:369-827(+)|eukprot:CAMPEP_0202448624 /NCGR_PEP_ID=MMETSP1360-20130828/7435_1 /ASSEMBLY_ACC=CAM_ASM_000848 /TAXON_ID=515479 /ORGANISM="Licmophora paradoxa, Strain CCMP2313" /LENGTH=152 /DNA_ID=CAMNT_0049066293 /DNA_START=97 /DNA_END=555 /DNA_ORIENTATION=+
MATLNQTKKHTILLQELIDSGFYNETRFFRVVDHFVVQWGINGDPSVSKKWAKNEIPDDVPNIQSNLKGTISFASAGPNTRTTQVFINLVDNTRLDDKFMPIAEIVSGFEEVLRINNEYQQLPDQSKIQSEGNVYLEKEFPNLSYIVTMNSA